MTFPPVVILCGGRGTRLQEHTATLPKPLVEIGGRPILWHVMQVFASQGADRFVLCAGYKSELIAEFARAAPWPVECVNTGLDTPTGGRLHRVRERLGDGTFMLGYGDCVADLDLAALLRRHRRHGAAATLTVVQPELQFGVAVLDDGDRVMRFREKPRASQWVNAGFFCFEPRVFDRLDDASVLEREPLEQLAAEGELHAFRHTGFWACMDTYKDAVRLQALWASGRAPWHRFSSGRREARDLSEARFPR